MSLKCFDQRTLYDSLKRVFPDLPDRALDIQISFGVNRPATITVEYFPEVLDMSNPGETILETFNIEKIEEDQGEYQHESR